jgi:hypothetical protein
LGSFWWNGCVFWARFGWSFDQRVCGLWCFEDLAFGQKSVELNENAGDSKVKDTNGIFSV